MHDDHDDDRELTPAELDQKRAEMDELWSQIISMFISHHSAKDLDNDDAADAFMEKYMEICGRLISQGPGACMSVLAAACETVSTLLLEKFGSYAKLFQDQERRQAEDPLYQLDDGGGQGPGCAHCGGRHKSPMRSYESDDRSVTPGVGDKMICAQCLSVSVFQDVDGVIVPRVPTPEEQAELDADPDVRKWLAAAAVVKATREA